MNISKCPSCGNLITSINFEVHRPSAFKVGSNSYTATIYPCGHAISSVPITWENRLDIIENKVNRIEDKINKLENNILIIDENLRKLFSRLVK